MPDLVKASEKADRYQRGNSEVHINCEKKVS